MKSKAMIAAAVLIVIVVIGAAWAVWPRSEGTNDENAITVTDLAGRQVAVELPVKTVVLGDTDALGPFAAVAGESFLNYIIGGLGNFEQDYPDRYRAYIEKYPQIANIPSVGDLYTPTFSVEAVIDLQPDILILPYYSMMMGTAPSLELLEKAGIPTVFVDFFLDPYGDSQSQGLTLLGKLLGQEERAANIVEFYERQIDAVIDNIPADVVKQTVYFELNAYGPGKWGYTSATMGVSSIDYVGGENIAKKVMTSYGELDEQFILSEDPDYIIIGCNSNYGAVADGDKFGHGAHMDQAQLAAMAEPYLQRRGWSELDAVQEGRVHFVYAGLALSIENFAVLQLLATWLHPDVFADLDPVGSLEEFYELYMPIDLDGTWYYDISGTD